MVLVIKMQNNKLLTTNVPELMNPWYGTDFVNFIQEHDTYLSPFDTVPSILQ